MKIGRLFSMLVAISKMAASIVAIAAVSLIAVAFVMGGGPLLSPPDRDRAQSAETWIEDERPRICADSEDPLAKFFCRAESKSVDPGYGALIPRERALKWAEAEAEDREQKIEAAVAAFTPTRFYYNKPKTLRYRKASTITLAIASADEKRAKRFVNSGVGPVVSLVQPMGKEVTATLEGPPDQVDIRLRGEGDKRSATLPVSATSNAEWAWYVTPKTLDEVTLTLTLTSEVRIDGEYRPFGKETYEDRFTIQASWFDRLKVFFGAYWERILAAMATFAALYTAIFHRPKRRRPRAEAPDPVPPADPAPPAAPPPAAPVAPTTKTKTQQRRRRKPKPPEGDA